MDSFDLSKYLEMALRRKYWIIIPLLLAVLGGWTYMLITPKTYEAQTLILVQPQRVPADFIKSIVSTGVEDRLRTISQQVTSRTNLEAIIKEYQLYADSDLIIDDKVELIRKAIKLDVVKGGTGGGNAFSIFFRGKDPQKVMQVTNALASNFMTENLKIRESQAMGTSTFLADELESVRRKLLEKEEQLKTYREKFMGGMPENLQTTLSILGRLQMQTEQLSGNLRDAENRKLIVQSQLVEAKTLRRQVPRAEIGGLTAGPEQSAALRDAPDQLAASKKELALLESKYTPSHPDVVRLRKLITETEAKETETKTPDTKPVTKSVEEPASSRPGDLLGQQLLTIDREIQNIRSELKNIQSHMEMYQRRVDETPRREQEVVSMNRDYDNLKHLYSSMLNRKLEAEIAVSMEQKQKGEQFKVLDSAKLPVKPVDPDARKIILLTLVLGLGLGGGLAYLVELLDTSYKMPEEVEKELQLPVLVSIPTRLTEQELRLLKRKEILVAASVAIAFVLSAFGVLLAAKGMGSISGLVKGILSRG